MSRYEELKTKANNCRKTAAELFASGNNDAAGIWLDHSIALDEMAGELTIEEAGQCAKV